MAEERSGKRFKEEKKQEMQQKSQEDVQREETFKTWLTGLHRRRKVCFREKVFFFSLVHEPFALLVIGPNSLVKRDRGSISRGPKSARTLVWCSSVR